jgi:light-regulated signal transduction histidine kinase (bacteriophytochrome)
MLEPANCDINLMRHVLSNLVSNAIKYSSKKEKSIIEIGSHREDGEVIYFIKDNGSGFDMKYADKLFGVFQRLHHTTEFEGTGVGLAIVQRIVDMHGGRVWADAVPDLGATFYFSLQDE